jgi:4-diphosphocytidyl-2-C-methyl-D-erythritol kinase
MTTTRLHVRAHAKINLSLRVRGMRDDGYHELETVFQSLALHDDVTVARRAGAFRLRCDDPAVPTDDRNLVWRAAQGLWRATGRTGEVRGIDVTLTKQIPMQAGLGGGSTDAAAALVALAWLWKVKPSIDLTAVAASVGADVPYFLMGGTALGLSRGDDVYPLPDLPASHVVLGLPAFGVSTVDAYGWWDRDRKSASKHFAAAPAAPATIAAWPGRTLAITNDLEAAVATRHPEMGMLRDVLRSAGASAVAMTGSGSAVFGLFTDAARSRRAARLVAAAGFVALVTKTATRRDGQAKFGQTK